ILNILKKKGFIEYSENKKSYILSQKFINIFFKNIVKNPINFILEKIILNLKNRINEDIFIARLEDSNIKILKVYSTFNNTYFEKDEIPFYTLSSGKILVSFLKKRERENLINSINFKKYTDNTITKKDALIREIDKIRKDGFSISIEEYKLGYCDISIPIFDKKNKNLYSITIIFPKYKFTEGYKNFLIKELFLSKNNLEKKLKQFQKIFS
ncbi:MAG: IclR family transcriptional regulator C-terminal domain-containing protein, partial [Caldisericia bacterium]